MNKKVLTLCAAMLLSGSLVTIEAAQKLPTDTDFKDKIEFVDNGKVINFTEDVTLSPGDYLVITDSHVTVKGNQKTLNGRLVIKGEDVTVDGLIIKNDVSVNSGSFTKNAISIVASTVTLKNNRIYCSVSGTGKSLMANGVVIFPTKETVNYVAENNIVYNANVVTGEDASAALLIAENITPTGESTASKPITDFDISALASGFEFENCGSDYVYANFGSSKQEYKQVQVKPIYKDGKLQNTVEVNDILKYGTSTTEAIFKGTAEEFQESLTTSTEGKNVAVQCTGDSEGEGAANVLFGEVTNPDNGLGAVIAGITPAAEKVGGYELFKTTTSQFGLLVITEEDGTPYIVSQNEGSEAEVKEVAEVDLDGYKHNEAALWQMECVPTLDGQYQYKFVNKLGEQLKATSNTNDANAKKGIFVSSMKYGEYGVALHNVQNDKILSFGLYKTADSYFTAEQLIDRYGTYFTLGITYKDDKEKDVDVTGKFAGQLRPMENVYYANGRIFLDPAADDATNFMLVNEKDEIIVIDKKNPLHQGSVEYGYEFTTLTPQQWIDWNKNQTKDPYNKHDYKAKFQFAYDYNDKPSTTQAVTSIEIDGLKVGLEKDNNQIKLVADSENKLLEKPTISIKLNAGNGIEPKEWLTTPSYYKVEAINKDKRAPHYGKVLGLNEEGNVAWVAPENVDLTKPEGQFAIDEYYNFRNRENGKFGRILDGGELYKVAGEDNVYALVSPDRVHNDTLRITPITTYKSNDGFKRFTAAELNANTYTVAMKTLMGDPFIVENHNDKHRLGLSADEYTAWRIEMPTVKLKDATHDFTRMAADTVKVLTPITYWADNGWRTTQIDDPEDKYYAPNTQLEICTYVLKNTDNGEYLYGEDWTESVGNAYYVCNVNKKTATRIAFKENGEGTVNLVPAYGLWVDNSVGENWTTGMSMHESDYSEEYYGYAANLRLSYQKIEGGLSPVSEGGVLKDVNLYKGTNDDLFVIAPTEAPTYKKLAQGDKIILSLKSNTENVLVEGPKGGLATISNREAHKDLNPTLYVDTAYVNRVGNYAYQYLLSVRPTRIDTTYQCNLPEEHGVHRADTTKAFFLVNMVDSALANQNVHNNKFMYNGEYKLDFVEAYHTNDSLFFTEEGKVVSKMEVGNGDFNIAKYAFKMVDETENEFVIETASGYTTKKNWVKDNNGNWHWTVASVESKPGYLRWVNDNLVVTDDIDKAAIFTMEASDKEATANENIAAGNVVVAGVNGAVVVKGAEGKNVIVSTILGKVVANEVVSSDNATIAAPAGIVVVSVDGESFKVVVK